MVAKLLQLDITLCVWSVLLVWSARVWLWVYCRQL
jgi:hypothetical protein